ncbi:MAG TPA: glycine--tRNA ligase subunit beta [Gammaproteobacteria bacterium]|nr:glycine--tRNA ligase subunit beta [Gammaproteobacteria bacterium]
MTRQPDTRELLVEIGTEELPPHALAPLAQSFADNLHELLVDKLMLGEAGTVATAFHSPRRLAVLITALRVQQPDRHVERLGPALTAAYGPDGKPGKAAEGFARSCGVPLAELGERDGKLFYQAPVPGRPAAELIADAVNDALAKLPIPKRMRWGAGDAQFVRPVHWVVLLFGRDVIPGTVLGVTADRFSRGHRYLHPDPIKLNAAGDYEHLFSGSQAASRVQVDAADARLRKRIIELVRAQAEQAGGEARELTQDSALITEVAGLVEWPVALTGSFDPGFLTLPEEVLSITLQHHQRYFPLRDPASGKLLPKFVFVSNIESRQPAEVVRGNERVIVPRLTDAMFFWERDCAVTLASRIPELDQVTFQKQLGSYGDKARRVAVLAATIAKQIGGEAAPATRAAALAKCDLLSNLVGEFPELQGVMGKYFALHDGEPAEVAQAIEEHYLPRFAGDRLPATRTGQALAIADKLDTVAGIFAAGQAPTGDKDPFALRRQALGVLRIMIECGLELDLSELVRAALADRPQQQGQLLAVLNFFMERLRAYYQEQGVRRDVFEAVLAREVTRPAEFHRRLTGTQAFMQLAEAANLAAANKRIGNILQQAGGAGTTLDPALFETSAEISLYAAITRLRAETRPFLEQGDYTAVLTRLAALRAPVDAFFEKVMVMTDDAVQRSNRLALLAELQAMFLQVADLSRIQVE